MKGVPAGEAISLGVCVCVCWRRLKRVVHSKCITSDIIYNISVASCAVTDGRIVRTNAGTGGNGTAFVPCASGSGGSARQTVQISKCNHPTYIGTAFHLRDRSAKKKNKIENQHHWILEYKTQDPLIFSSKLKQK